ncbi:MAG TPA: TetR/AcrR family transcriptional regulator [Magnetospirillaceae bacterium]|jgi:AcrR family transcriptional regulator
MAGRANAKKVINKRAAIIDAAVTLFAHKGFYGTTVPEIAEKAGVATGSIYLYFQTKEALVNAALAERKQGMYDAFSGAASGGGDLEARFRRTWRALVAYAVAHPADFLFFEMHHHAAYLDPATHESGQKIMLVAIDFMREITGAYRVDSPAPEVLVALVWGGLVGLLKFADQGFLRLDPQLVDAAGLALWHAVTGKAPLSSSSTTVFPTTERQQP